METPRSDSDTAAAAGPATQNKEVIRLVDLLHQVETAEQKEVSLQNLVGHLTKHYPTELLPVMDRLSKWDASGASMVLYAKVALQKNQVKLAQRIIDPLLVASGAPDSTLLLGARIYVRVGDLDRAKQLVGRIPADSPLEKGIREVEAKIEAANIQKSN
jgi:hypothetical protein